MPEKLPPGETVIPLAEETIAISKREVETGQVRVALTTDVEQMVVRETLRGRRVEVERGGRRQDPRRGRGSTADREESDPLVIPVVEEMAVVVKRLFLREEVRLRFVQTDVSFEQEVDVRRQRATVERVTPDATSTSNQAAVRDTPI